MSDAAVLMALTVTASSLFFSVAASFMGLLAEAILRDHESRRRSAAQETGSQENAHGPENGVEERDPDRLPRLHHRLHVGEASVAHSLRSARGHHDRDRREEPDHED